MRETMKELHRKGLDSAYGLFNTIHDSCLFHFPEELLDQHIRDVYPIFTAPSKVLKNSTAPDGLVIGCEASYGKRWSEMKEIDFREFLGVEKAPDSTPVVLGESR
jgi:hypothetical protein